jgi:hypothetical protein
MPPTNQTSKISVDAANQAHRELGASGLLEDVYEEARGQYAQREGAKAQRRNSVATLSTFSFSLIRVNRTRSDLIQDFFSRAKTITASGCAKLTVCQQAHKNLDRHSRSV